MNLWPVFQLTKGSDMADYTTVDAVKAYLRITTDSDDTLLADLIRRACRIIDDHCARRFDSWVETRVYDATNAQITGHTLLLDADLLALTALTNGDGSAIDLAATILRPVNWPPYFGISLREGSGLNWVTSSAPGCAIRVTGTWGYAETVPEPIEHAAVRLAAWLYRQRDGSASDELLPRDVRDLLAPYIRLRLKSIDWAGSEN